MSKNTASRWEAGTVPHGARLDALAEVLETSADWILRGEERSAPETPRPDPAHWREFLDRYEHAADLTEGQLAGIREFAAIYAPHSRSWLDYERVAEVVRTSSASPTAERKKARRDN